MPNDLTPADVRRLVGYEDALILEIGANEGDDSAGFLEAFPSGWLECFECDARAIAKWNRNIDNERARLWEVAVADHCGPVQFFPSDGTPPGQQWDGYGDHWDKSGSLLPNDHHTDYSRWLRFGDPVAVAGITLDCWARQHLRRPRVAFAWIDCQGAEAMVLRGAVETLPRIDWVYCECHRLPFYQGQATRAELDELLAGFARVGTFGDNYLWENKVLA
jgi:FkbM family methyltransferase